MNTYGTSMAKPLDEVRQHTIVPVPNTVTMYRSLVACSVINFSPGPVFSQDLSFGFGNKFDKKIRGSRKCTRRWSSTREREVELNTQTRKFSVYVARSTWDIEAVEIDLRDGR